MRFWKPLDCPEGRASARPILAVTASPRQRRYPVSKIADICQQVRSEISKGNPGRCQNKHDAEKKQVHQVNNDEGKEGAMVRQVRLFLRDHPAGKGEVKRPGCADQSVEKPAVRLHVIKQTECSIYGDDNDA